MFARVTLKRRKYFAKCEKIFLSVYVVLHTLFVKVSCRHSQNEFLQKRFRLEMNSYRDRFNVGVVLLKFEKLMKYFHYHKAAVDLENLETSIGR